MTHLERLNAVIKHVWTEPKAVAFIEWHADHPTLAQAIFAAVGRPEAERYAATGQWDDEAANTVVTVEIHEPPDFDWWEPRHDQPWRRQQARDCEFDAWMEAQG